MTFNPAMPLLNSSLSRGIIALAATTLAHSPSWSVEITRLSGVEFGGAPNVVGAGARAMGMGYAFSAVADDATASTWNPAGMSQLERPEFAISTALSRVEYGSGDDANWDADIDNASIIFPFHIGGIQQTVGLARQRQLDFDATWSSASSSVTPIGGFLRLVKDETATFEREGEFTTLSLSYAVEPLSGFSLGFTLNTWDHALTGASETESTYRFNTLANTFVTATNTLVNSNTERTTSREKRSVSGGFSTNIGAMWKVMPEWTLALVLRPPFTIEQEATWQRLNIDGATVTRQSGSYASDIDLPLTMTLGTAWRIDDLNTFTFDATWTRWSDFRIAENGTSYSAVDPRLNPDQIDDNWALRAGYEHIIIHPRVVSAWRLGGYYEALPGAAPVASLNPRDRVNSSNEVYWGFTVGTGLFWRRHIIDLAAELRYGEDVGAGRITGPNQTTKETRYQIRMNYTFHF